MAGYSGTPLPQKLGLKPGARFGTFGAPADFARTLGALPAGVLQTDGARGRSPLDVMVCVADSRAALEKLLPRAQQRLDPSGGLWICWPKKASGRTTDVAEADVRRLGLAQGLVDNKVCAMDDVWSGLRLVVRLADRPTAKKAAPSRARAASTPTKSSRKRTATPVRAKAEKR
jgi:hypothetical protein